MIKFIKKICDLLFVAIIIVLVAYLFLRYTNQICIYKVKTGSMEDNIHVGDYVLIIHKDNYKVGDVVTFEKEDGFITHRIIKINGDNITTKGDANNVEDDNIDVKSIVGKVIISGGIINILINYKYALVAGFLSIYLFSCYFGKKENDDEKSEKLVTNEEDEKLLEDCNDEIKDEEKDTLQIDDNKEVISVADEKKTKIEKNNDDKNKEDSDKKIYNHNDIKGKSENKDGNNDSDKDENTEVENKNKDVKSKEKLVLKMRK